MKAAAEIENQKCKRFRFTEAERVKAIKETFNVVCEDACATEEELWNKVHKVLMYDNPRRFEHCSVRLLKSHVLEQMARFKKFDDVEATESGKERLQTPWGKSVRTLLTVWDIYERVVNDNDRRKSSQSGRPKKLIEKKPKENIDLAKAIRDAALRATCTAAELEVLNDDIVAQEGKILEPTLNAQEQQITAEDANASPKKILETPIQRAKKRRKPKDNGVFEYLGGKNRMEMEFKREKLMSRNAQHKENIRLQAKDLAFKRAKLDFEKEKWQVEVEKRKAQLKKDDVMLT